MTNTNSGAPVWSDDDFLRAFEELTFPADQFHHREHIRVAWLYLKSSDATRAAERMAASIRRFANHHGATQKYHHTLTLFWMRLVAVALVETPDGLAFEEFSPLILNCLTKASSQNSIRRNSCKPPPRAKAGSTRIFSPYRNYGSTAAADFFSSFFGSTGF